MLSLESLDDTDKKRQISKDQSLRNTYFLVIQILEGDSNHMVKQSIGFI